MSMATTFKWSQEWLSYTGLTVVPIFNCQIDLKYSHQLTQIHERGFFRYLFDNGSAEKRGRRLNLQAAGA